MHTHTQKQFSTQKKETSPAVSVFDSSSQSDSLQRKADMLNAAAQRAEAPRPNNTGMPDNLKAGIESLSGYSMDDVRVHYNSSKPATVQALAYTQGTDIHVAPGQEKHLPHEAWHVAQQMAGRVSPTTNINGMPVNDDPALECEADALGAQASSIGKSIMAGDGAVQRMGLFSHNGVGHTGKGTLQRMPYTYYKKTREKHRKYSGKHKIFKDSVSDLGSLLNLSKRNDIVQVGKLNKEKFNACKMFFEFFQNDVGNLDDINKKIKEIDCIEDLKKEMNNCLKNDTKYWISWEAQATGDLPSMTAAILMGLKKGIGIKDSKNDDKTIEAKERLNEVASYFGGIVYQNDVYSPDGLLRASVRKQNECESRIPFSWLTKVVATGKYDKKYGKNVEEDIPLRENGVKKEEIKKIKKTWVGGFDTNRMKNIRIFLKKYGIEKRKLTGKKVEVLWIRKSGEKGGAHYENDTSFNALDIYIERNKGMGKFFILAGDEKNGKAEKIANKYGKESVANLTEFWKSREDCENWGGNTRTGQLAIYEYMKSYFGCKSFTHIGSMSGGLEALALIGHEVKYKAKDGENGVDRVVRYSDNKTLNDVSYEKTEFWTRKGIVTDGFEKRSAKYYALFSNTALPSMKNMTSDKRQKEYENLLESEYGYLKKYDYPELIEEMLSNSKKAAVIQSVIFSKVCVKKAKDFAKSEKYKEKIYINKITKKTKMQRNERRKLRDRKMQQNFPNPESEL